MLPRALVAVLLGSLVLAHGSGVAASQTSPAGPTAAHAASGLAVAPAANEAPAGDDGDGTSDRPEDGAWIVGLVVFVGALALVVGGRWWVRTRVARVQR
jgi:hypothetical protein